MATLAFSGKVREVIKLLKAFEIGFDRKSDATTIRFIGTLFLPDALVMSKDFITEFYYLIKEQNILMVVIQCVLSDINDTWMIFVLIGYRSEKAIIS